jgi:hypothetical protein
MQEQHILGNFVEFRYARSVNAFHGNDKIHALRHFGPDNLEPYQPKENGRLSR